VLPRIRRLFRNLPTLSSHEAYALWADSYPPHAHNQLMQIEQEAMLRLMPPLAGRDVLDLACGSGRYGVIAQQSGARRVISTDNSVPMLRIGIQAGVIRVGIESSMNALPFQAKSFDVVLCGLALGHLPPDSMPVAVAEMARILRPGGTALFSDFHPYVYLSGGRRTFRAPDGMIYNVEHYPHLVADYVAAVSAVGMTITALEEPRAELNGKLIPAALIMRCSA
jgi:malonyl-CoA O-methyltransferase